MIPGAPALLTTGLLILTLFTLPTKAVNDDVRKSEWFLDYLRIATAHQVSRGSGVLIGLPDSGSSPHPDLRNNLLKGIDLAQSENHNGHVDLIDHGTGIAGLIVAHGQGLTDGVLGIAPEARVLPINVYASDRTIPALERGIDFAIAEGAQVINISAAVGPSRKLEAAINAARNADALVVAASGNDPKGILPGYPAAIPGVLATGAIDSDSEHAEFSLPGPNVAICAPGAEITTTARGSTYQTVNGTSAAAAIVSGAAALVRARFPGLSAPEVAHRLTATATDIGPPGRDDECGFGVLNIVKALTADIPPLNPATAGNEATTPPPPDETSTREAAENPMTLLGAAAGIATIAALVLFLAFRRRGARR